MKSIGKCGEYRVLACLLERDIEVYQAINVTQPDFDLTAILNKEKIVRIQVKSTALNNKATNNAIGKIDKEYDFLVVVIFQREDAARFFVMTKKEAMQLKGSDKQLGVTKQQNNKFQVKNALIPHEDKWDKIKNA